MSLYIPHIFSNYTKEDITYIFEDLKIGVINRIDFVTKMNRNGKIYNAAYIHFKEWYDNTASRNLQERIRNPNREARVMYDDPWYWVVLENTADKFVPGERKKRISLDFTPEKEEKAVEPKAPVKILKKQNNINITPRNLNIEFVSVESGEIDEDKMDDDYIDQLIQEFYDNEEQEMDEIEEAIEEDDKHLVYIDSRYVKSIEEENKNLRKRVSGLEHVINQMNNTIIHLRNMNENTNKNISCMY